MANISVKVGNNMNSKLVIVEDSKTPREIFDESGYTYSSANIHLGGAPMDEDKMDTSLADLGCEDFTTLISVVKADGGIR